MPWKEGWRIDWKPYYRRELESPAGRRAVDDLLRRADDAKLVRAIKRGAILSFPHTALDYAGPVQARVVGALYRAGVERVIALGVLHSSGSAAYRTALDEEQPNDVRRAAYEDVLGAWLVPGAEIDTPFGDLPVVKASEDERVPVRFDRSGLLTEEFSLDTFLSLLRRRAVLRDVEPPEVLRVFVGPTREPLSRSFAVAERLAAWVRRAAASDDRRTAIVTTGDLVHYGTAYGDPGADSSEARGAATDRFRPSVERMLEAGLAARDWPLAHQLSTGLLHSDQREILAVVSGILGPARARLLHFELSDYARILGMKPPCWVASALVAYERADACDWD